jgi:beta-lactamase regulating signal transducer with metallopeptidase domain
VFVPSYWRYEPAETLEGFDVTLVAVAAIAVALLAAASARGLRAWRHAERRVRAWMQSARPLGRAHALVPAFEIDGDAPMMALAGVLRPRLLVTRALVAALTDEELAASVAHEIGHCRARDNLKRLVMRAAPDFLTSTPAARTLERRWASAAEHAADRMRDNATPDARFALASALVKVARLMPPSAASAEPISTLVGGGDIASRVQRLLEDRPPAGARGRLSNWLAVAGLAVLVVTYGPLLQIVHQATEILVHALP